jgi:hypothetical protein
MKAKPKRVKRRLKSGRPRISGMERSESGRIRRNQANSDARGRSAMATVMDMRERQYGARDATAPEWGYVLGRVYMDGRLGKISGNRKERGLAEMRLEAGDRYAMDIGRYYGLTGIQFPSARAQNMFAVGGFDGDVTQSVADAARNASNRMMDLEGALLRCSDGRSVAATVKNVCIMDIEEARDWPLHMFEYLRRGLDALILFYGLREGANRVSG